MCFVLVHCCVGMLMTSCLWGATPILGRKRITLLRPQVLLPHNLYVDFLHMKRHGLWNLNCTKIRCLSNHFSATGLNSNLHQLCLYFFIQLHNLLPNSRMELNFRKHTTEVLSYGCVRFATGVASQQGTLTLPDTWFRPPFWDLLMLQLLRPNSSNLPCLYSTFHLEYPLVLPRFYLDRFTYITICFLTLYCNVLEKCVKTNRLAT